MTGRVLLEDSIMRLTQLPGRIYVMDVFHNLSRTVMSKALEGVWSTPGWRQPWGLVIVMHDSATYDSEVRKLEVPPPAKRAVGTSIVTQKPVQRMVIKSIGMGLGLVSKFFLSAAATVEEAVAVQVELIKTAEQKNRPY